jgi:hypothetical protein
MKWRKRTIQTILAENEDLWDTKDMPIGIRREFRKVVNCRTGALGHSRRRLPSGEVVWGPNSCKSRACPSCGWKATLDWVYGIKATLPDCVYAGIGFSMPDVLWDVFLQNRDLLKDLPVIGGEVISSWAQKRFQCELPILVVRHSFGAHLNFNAHLHILVPTVGLSNNRAELKRDVFFPEDILVKTFRHALLDYLSAAARAGLLVQSAHVYDIASYLESQYDALWHGDVKYMPKSDIFAGYIARYLRRPPIAGRRLLPSKDGEVRFLTFDKELKKKVADRVSTADFITMLAEQVPTSHDHCVRYFGLLTPRRSREFGLLWSLLGQQRPNRPAHLSYAECLLMIPEKQRRL